LVTFFAETLAKMGTYKTHLKIKFLNIPIVIYFFIKN